MDYPEGSLRILVLDDASGEETRQALLAAMREIPIVTVSFQTQNRGKRLNLIDGVRACATELVLSVDSDVIVETDTLKQLVLHLTDDVAAVGGVVRVSNADHNLLTRIQEVKYFLGYELLKGLENQFSKVMCLSGCLTLYRREVLLELEGHLVGRNLLGRPVKYGEDRFLTRKIVEGGHKTRLCHTAICHTRVPATFDEWFKQQLRWRRSNLVDFLGGWWKAHRLPLPVALHYSGLGLLLIVYPIIIVHHLLAGELLLPLVAHGAMMAVGVALYVGRSAQSRSGLRRVDPLPFLFLPVLLVVNYVMITPLAMLTLVTVKWETRSSEPAQPLRSSVL